MSDNQRLPPTPVYKVAAIQYAPTLFEKEKNLLDQLEMVEEAAKNDARLIVMVEMATTAYCFFDRAEIAPYVEPIPGPTTDRFGEIATRYDCYIVVGMPEVDSETDIYYNSLALVGPEGVVGKYRKTHSFISENTWAKDGDLGLPVFQTELGNLGGLICMDASFPETARVLALRGADVICFPTNWLLEKAPAPAWMTRAFENGVYLIAADRWGNERTVEFSGGSAVINPDGAVQSYMDTSNGIVYGTIDISQARDKRFTEDEAGDKLLERRPTQYQDSLLNSYLFNPDDYFGLYGQYGLPEGKESIIAVCQVEESAGAGKETLATVQQMLDGVHDSYNVLVLPELSLSGPVTTETQANSHAVEIEDSEPLRLLTSLAMHNDAFIATSIIERDSGRMYHTAVLVGPEGLVGSYRKVHISEYDRAWATPGDGGFPVFDISVGRVGLMVGHDAMFPEAARAFGVKGADLICVPAALKYPRVTGLGPTAVPFEDPIIREADDVHWHLLRSRSEENNAFVAFANRCGGDYIGRSGVFDKQGDGGLRREAVASEDRPEIVSLAVSTTQPSGLDRPATPGRVKDMVRMRQTFWYSPLVQPHPTSRDT